MNEYESSMIELFTYSENIRKLIYTTNAIESVNSCLRKVTNGKGCFINKVALEKVLYLRIKDLEKKWKRTTRANWTSILNELIELFGERVERYIEIQKKDVKKRKNIIYLFIYLFIYAILIIDQR